MSRDKLDELITDVYRAKLVYEAEMKSPEYRAKGEEDFEFIGKALAAKGYCKASDVAREIDDLKRYILLSEDIAIKCKRENGEQNEEYWRGKVSAFRAIRAYIDAELKKKYIESEKDK